MNREAFFILILSLTAINGVAMNPDSCRSFLRQVYSVDIADSLKNGEVFELSSAQLARHWDGRVDTVEQNFTQVTRSTQTVSNGWATSYRGNGTESLVNHQEKYIMYGQYTGRAYKKPALTNEQIETINMAQAECAIEKTIVRIQVLADPKIVQATGVKHTTYLINKGRVAVVSFAMAEGAALQQIDHVFYDHRIIENAQTELIYKSMEELKIQYPSYELLESQ